LEPGDYSVFVDSSGRGDVVTLRPKATAAGIRAHVMSRVAADGPNALIVRSAGKQRRLEAISLEKPKVMLYLQPARKARNSRNAWRIDLVPVAYSTSRAAER
jgi:hypothetical protein